MKIAARKCPFTGKIFETDPQYTRHLAGVRGQQRQRRAWKHIGADGDAAILWATHHVTSADEFDAWFRQSWSALVGRGYRTNANDNDYDKYKSKQDIVVPKLLSSELSIGSYGFQSNSHSCPSGGVTNFRGDPSLPRGYMGWFGRVNYKFAYSTADSHACGFGMFRDSVIHTGTGGGGCHGYAFDFSLWADEWPAWKLVAEQRRVWDIISTP
jgi:hypothetical protein